MNLLPLDTWREIMGFHPWHFWGWADQEGLAITSSCNPIVYEYSWQAGGADISSRYDIREAISAAEASVQRIFNIWPAPKYTEVTYDWPKLKDRRMIRTLPSEPDGRWLSVQLDSDEVQAVGVLTHTSIATNVTMTLLDDDGDGYPDWALIGPITIPTTTPATTASEIAIYFNQADRGAGVSVSDEWRIEPIQTSLSGTTVNIRCRPWLLTRPSLLRGMNPAPLDPAVQSNFAQTVDVYRRWINTRGTTVDTSQSVIYWETRPSHGWWCCCGSCGSGNAFNGAPYDPAAQASAIGRVGIRNGPRGLVHPAEVVYNSDTGIFASLSWEVCEEPDRVLIRQYAGVPLVSGNMDPRWATIISRYATAEIGRPICGCATANRTLHHWQQDLSKIGNDKELYFTDRSMLVNPFGSRRGHWWAWKELSAMPFIRGLSIG